MTDTDENSGSTPNSSATQNDLDKKNKEVADETSMNKDINEQPEQIEDIESKENGDINLDNQYINLNGVKTKNQIFAQNLQNLVIKPDPKDLVEKFDDPTEPFILDNKTILEIDTQIIERYCHELERERILLINCFDVNVLSAFPTTLLEKGDLKLNDKRILLFKGGNLNREDLNIDSLVNKQIGENKPVLIMIEIFDANAQDFLDSLFQIDTQNYINIIKTNLRIKERMLLFLVEKRLFSKTKKETKKEFLFQPKVIDFLPHVLKRYNYSTEEVKELQNEIEQQRRQYLWGDDDNEYYSTVIQYLRNHELSEQVEKRRDKNSFLRENRNIEPGNLFKNNEPIKNIMIYTSVYFPGASHYEFDKINHLLLGMKKGFMFEKMIKTDEDGEKELIDIPTEVLLKEIYEKQADKLMDDCYLEVSRNTESTHTVLFSNTYLRNDMKDYLEKKHFSFLTEQFRIIQNSGLFFDPQASPELLGNIIKLFVEMASSNPDRYGKDWLFRIVSALRTQGQEIEVDVESNDEYELLEQVLIQLIEKEHITRWVYDRLADLIREMLNQPRLKEMIESFLEQLIRMGQHEITLRLVLEITQRLRFAPNFNQLYWLKQLLDRGNETTRNSAYEALRREARHSNLRIYEFLGEIETWLPERDRPLEKYSMSNGYALQFLIDYSFLTIANLDIEHYGLWPSKYPLFANLEKKSASGKFVILANWFFHPGMRYLDNEELGIDISLLISDIFIDWFLILHGLHKDFPMTETREIFDILIIKIVEVASMPQQKLLLDRWRNEADSLLDKIKKSKGTNLEQEKNLTRKRNFIRFLVKRFKERQNEKESEESENESNVPIRYGDKRSLS